MAVKKGTSAANTLTGTAIADYLYGFAGADTLSGLGGNDHIFGGDGNDSIAAGDGNNTVTGDAGNDTATAGTGKDTVDGGSGDDNLSAGSGNDLVRGQAGLDTIDGGDGVDKISGYTGNDSLTGGAGNDSIFGEAGNDVISGGDDKDTLLGGTGNDTINGGNANDTIDGGVGSDSINGGNGTDWLVFDDSAKAAVALDLLAGTGSAGNANGDTYAAIENVKGTGYGDTITGDTGANYIQGMLGKDSLSGGGGNDTLEGGAANDTLNGGAGSDKLDGGGGTDTVSYAGSSAGVTVRLDKLSTISPSGGDAAGDTFVGVENIIGSSNNDVLSPSGGGDADGGDGNDTIYAGSGAATGRIDGGIGADVDTLDGTTTTASTQFVVRNDGAIDIINGFVQTNATPDQIVIMKSLFTQIATAAGGAVTVIDNLAGGHGASGGVAGTFIYDVNNHGLWYDADGLAGGEVQIANLTNATIDTTVGLVSEDFLLV